MGSKKEYIGTLEVTLESGKFLDINVHKKGRNIWINDKIVHPSNENSFNGIIDEIGITYQSVVKEWNWKMLARPLEFRRYRT